MTATPQPIPKPRRPRRPRDEMEVFGKFIPWKNPAAVYSYGVSIAALVPVLGLALGPVAVVLGVAGLIRVRRRPETLGKNFAVAGLLIGSLSTLFNAAGVWCVGRGLEWW